jgi:hypothetical protein
MNSHDQRLLFHSDLLRDAAITMVAVVLAFLALDDITTDTAPSFMLERTALAGCASWFGIVAWRLMRQGHRVLGGLSLGLVLTAALAQRSIGPGTVWMQLEYLATVGCLVWFVVLAGILARFAWRQGNRYAA